MIGEVTWRRDMSGTACELTLMLPEAFWPEPILDFALPQDAAAALAHRRAIVQVGACEGKRQGHRRVTLI